MIVFDLIGDPQKSEILTPGDTAKGISPALFKGDKGAQVKAALITVEDNTINYTLDGTTPATGSGAGHQGLAELNLVLRGVDAVKKFQCIDRVSGGGSASKVKVTVFF